ncbi:sigma-54-dependent Fis family transcriptional regulator [Aliikangiella marina]|uniref:Sigma-54-dependent Fis family transcriptional regulator n=2 Tax=Aliikangiella marina TaxID=1712262 RepID=A0A545T393_9GAMM|nr:sigma-54-dependent Fis family transcriptional regulator [Aliikangiella marina]
MIGQSASFQNVLKRIRTFSACDAPVLIEGETGTGKEMIARAVHYYSDRKEHPFIPVNCGALPDNLIENELFGHVKGAYTDAKTQSTGLVGQANGGTLFLDEIESLTPKSQVALMRFLQEKEYKPLGSNVPLKSDIRIVTASNVAIDKLVAQRLMRQDLFFRLNILSVQLPPLKDRGDDIELLANHFLVKFQEQYELPVRRYHQKTLDWFKAYHWPGNIRELENLVLRAVLVCDDEFISPRHFCDDNIYIQNQIQHAENQFVSDEFGDAELSVDESFSEAKSRVINSFEKCYLKKLMQKYAGNVTLAAKFACKERRALGKLLKKHGISRQNYLS